MRTPNRHIMYKRYQDGEITETEYKNYLSEQDKREKQTSKRFMKYLKDNKKERIIK